MWFYCANISFTIRFSRSFNKRWKRIGVRWRCAKINDDQTRKSNENLSSAGTLRRSTVELIFIIYGYSHRFLISNLIDG